MSVFEYKAIDINGKQTNGLIDGDTKKNARQKLQSKQLTILAINISKKKSRKKKSLFEPKLRIADIVIITRQLASLLQASLPIDEALKVISKNSDKKYISTTVAQIHSSIVEGNNLADSLALNMDLPSYFISTVEAGERAGKLGEVLNKLSLQIHNQEQFLKKISAALVYPLFIVIMSITVVTALLVFVVPQIVSIFEDMEQTLPPLTVFVIATSDFFKENILQIIILFTFLYISFKLMLLKENIKAIWQKLISKIPVIGSILVNSNSIRFSRIFSLLHENGTPIVLALTNSANTLSYLPMKKNILTSSEKVREGSSIFKAMQSNNSLPPTVLYMLASGEASGNLSEMLSKSAETQELDLDNYISKIMNLFGPLMLLVMGVVVALIVLAILLPILELNQVEL
jgi:general secretion pathway protein F